MSEESAWAKVDELTEKLERVKGIVDRVAADPSNATDELWVYSIRKALDGDQPFVISPRKVIVLHMVYPDGTHTGDCEGCLWSQEQPA